MTEAVVVTESEREVVAVTAVGVVAGVGVEVTMRGVSSSSVPDPFPVPFICPIVFGSSFSIATTVTARSNPIKI